MNPFSGAKVPVCQVAGSYKEVKVTGTVTAFPALEGTREAHIHGSRCGNHVNFVARNSKLQKTRTERLGLRTKKEKMKQTGSLTDAYSAKSFQRKENLLTRDRDGNLAVDFYFLLPSSKHV